MVRFVRTTAALFVAAAASQSSAFQNPTSFSVKTTRTSTTNLQAALPPMIIGPMIRKMREEQEKKKLPMAQAEETVQEAPGLRVGRGAWKWPPVWPYDPSFFTTKEDLQDSAQKSAMNGMAGMLTGVPSLPKPEEIEVADEGPKFQPLEYWGVDKVDETTNMDADAVEKLKSHYAYYLKDDMKILELGAAEESYLPDGLKPKKVVGVGANQKLMDKNSALTESLVVDLNNVVEGEGVDSDDLKGLGAEEFDAIIMCNTVDFLTAPREVFRTAWELLKPGGIMIVSFSSKDYFKNKFERAQTKMWRDFNDDQHMWIVGSMFQFSAGEGWEDLIGFDISPESAKEMDSGPFSMFKEGKNNNVYAVQAVKAKVDEVIDAEDPEKSFQSKMWMLPTMESRDKKLVAPRLARVYQALNANSLLDGVKYLPKVYESLVKMDQFAFTFNMQAQLAVDLVSDPDFAANEEQLQALKEGLGLRTPSETFWVPIGENTGSMLPEDRINLLAHLVPRFGMGEAQDAALEAFVSGMKPTYAVIRSKCPNMSESDVQLLGTELLAAEVLKPGVSTRAEYAAWLGALTADELQDILEARKQPKKDSDAELAQFRKEKAEQEAARVKKEEEMNRQIKKAREERTMAFNPETGKMEEIVNQK